MIFVIIIAYKRFWIKWQLNERTNPEFAAACACMVFASECPLLTGVKYYAAGEAAVARS
jgi:hypothetical protein